MALLKSKEAKGELCNYWKIVNVIQSFKNNETIVNLGLYKSIDTRITGYDNYLNIEEISFEGTDYTRTDLYSKIKESVLNEEDDETNFFIDAADC